MLSTGAETFEFKTMANSKESENLVAGNYIAFREDEQDKLFNINNILSSFACIKKMSY